MRFLNFNVKSDCVPTRSALMTSRPSDGIDQLDFLRAALQVHDDEILEREAC